MKLVNTDCEKQPAVPWKQRFILQHGNQCSYYLQKTNQTYKFPVILQCY